MEKIAVGTDSRITGPALKEAFINGLRDSGFMTTIDPALQVEGGVMLTASHLPFNRNGMKFFTEKGWASEMPNYEGIRVQCKGG